MRRFAQIVVIEKFKELFQIESGACPEQTHCMA